MRIECKVKGHEGEWIERVDRVSVKQWREWKAADTEKTQAMFDYFIVDWNLTDAEGKQVKDKPFTKTFESLEVAFSSWIVQAISRSVIEDMNLDPNWFAASPTTEKAEAAAPATT